MATSIRPVSIARDVAELMKANRRVGGAIAASQVPIPAKDRLVITTNGQPATWQLSAIPDLSDLGSSLNLSLNGIELDEATAYSVDYTTGLVTFSSAQQALFRVTPAPADVLTADYTTSDDLIAQTLTPDTGPATAAALWRISSNQAVATAYPGGGTWVAAYVNTGVTHNDITATISTLSSGEMNLGTLKPDGRQRCGAQVISGAVHLIYGKLDASGTYIFVDPLANVATAPSTPFTLRVALTGNVLSCWINGVLQGTTLTVDATSMITYGASTMVGMLDMGGGHWDDFMTSDGTTVVDHFTRADTTSGLGSTTTGQVWTYWP